MESSEQATNRRGCFFMGGGLLLALVLLGGLGLGLFGTGDIRKMTGLPVLDDGSR
jgi:hypothetical protein